MSANLYKLKTEDPNMNKEYYLHENQNIQGIIVFTQCARDEAIVMRVDDRRIQDSINLRFVETGKMGKELIRDGDRMKTSPQQEKHY